MMLPKPVKREKSPKRLQRRKRLNPVSGKRRDMRGEYAAARRAFLAGRRCAVHPELPATEVHHMAGRDGDRLMDQSLWLPVSREGHRRIHDNPAWAYRMGYLRRRNDNTCEFGS